MKLFLVACLVSLAVGLPTYEPIINGHNYHELVGIPLAARIKAAEEAADFDGQRIVGGSPATLGTHPHLGGLLTILGSGATSVCGSSLLTNTRSITAAHCWGSNYRSMTVVLGTITLFSGGTRLTATRIEMHAQYNPNNLNNDVAVITVPHVNYNNNIRNIALPSGTELNNNFAGMTGQAAGYGRTSDGAGIGNNQFKSHVNLPVITNQVCQQTFGSNTIVASTICTSSAHGGNVCGGDSGGPLTVTSGSQRILIGVASFVAAAGCQHGFPAGFARVTSFNTWIRNRL